jgi:aspartate kinase
VVVLKFGGTSIGTVEAIRRVSRIVASEPRPRVVVVSALSGVTDALLQIASGGATTPGTPPPRALDALLRRHLEASAMVRDRAARTALTHELYAIAGHVAATLESGSGALLPRSRDDVVAAGELWSSRLIAAVLRDRGVPAVWVDARAIMKTDGRHEQASPNLAATREAAGRFVIPILERGGVAILGGFIGSDAAGATTTLGRGGSDWSASVFGACLEATEIQIWTDVDGVLTADPRLVPHARVVPHLSYAEADDLAAFGAKVLHPGTIAPAVERGIAVVVRNSHRPATPGTLVSAVRPETHAHVIAGLACRPGALAEGADGLATVTVVGEGLAANPALAADASRALQDIRAHAISHHADRRALSFVVDAAHAKLAMVRLHDCFFAVTRERIAAQSPAVQA